MTERVTRLAALSRERDLYEATVTPEFDPMDLVYPDEVPLFEKYDTYVPAELVRKGFAYGILAVDEMKARIQSWSARQDTIEMKSC